MAAHAAPLVHTRHWLTEERPSIQILDTNKDGALQRGENAAVDELFAAGGNASPPLAALAAL